MLYISPTRTISSLEKERRCPSDPTRPLRRLTPAGSDRNALGKLDPMSLPPYGCEVFVGGLSRETTEASLREFLGQVGSVVSIRMPR